ncbi:MAG: hypothetical protein H6Q31_1218 [Bacteroidetes bacterium]|jgi:uncharacterized membrane protein|nr:hypothetical protein [Bacteroidota bacterium]
MDLKAQQKAEHTMRRRSFVFRAASAVAAGLTSGHFFRHLAQGAPPAKDPEKSVTIHPHPDAVPRTTPGPQSHE